MTARTQPVAAPTGQRYGEAGAQQAAQREIPLPNNLQPAPSGGASPQAAPIPRPDVFGATQRPNEPLTAGAGLGPGPGEMGMLPDDPLDFIRAIYMTYPSDGLRRLLERAANGRN